MMVNSISQYTLGLEVSVVATSELLVSGYAPHASSHEITSSLLSALTSPIPLSSFWNGPDVQVAVTVNGQTHVSSRDDK